MAVMRTVRVVRVVEVQVEAEYGDTDSDLCAKVTKTAINEADGREERIVLENFESQYDTYEEYVAAEAAPNNPEA